MAKLVRRSLLVVVALCIAPISRADVPKILLIQLNVPPAKDGTDLNVPVLDPLAEEFDLGGKVAPIAWSMTDPNFRNALMEGRIKEIPSDPNLKFAHEMAKALPATYLLACESKQVGVNVQASAQLFRSGRQIWKDTFTIRVQAGRSDDLGDAARSIARTLAMKVQSEPLKSLPVATKAPTSDPTQGQLPTLPPVTTPDKPVEVPTPPPVENPVTEPPKPEPDRSAERLASLRTEVQDLLAGGREAAAILRIRDAIDERPLDPGPRRLLVETLMNSHPEAAAMEARRAAAIEPDDVELRVLAARAWLQADRPADAQTELNEVLARHPESVPTRLLSAEIALRNNLPEQALEHVNAALKPEPSAEAYFMRAMVRSVLGGTDGVQQDLDSAKNLSPEVSPSEAMRRYRLAIVVSDASFDRLGEAIKGILPRAAVRPKDKEVAETIEGVRTQVASQIAFLNGLMVPSEAKQAHARRLLARNLLVQSAMDLIAFSEGSQDAIGDARINLGDAIRQMGTARGEWTPARNGTAPNP